MPYSTIEKYNEYKKTISYKKRYCKANWFRKGFNDNFDIVFDKWINSTNCEKCGCEYTKDNVKCMDHCHITGKFRNILCNGCNTRMLDRKKQSNNISGHKNISFDKRDNVWRYKKTHNKTNKTKFFRNKIDAICYKYIYILKIKCKLV